MVYDPNNYINGVDQRTESMKKRHQKVDEAKAKAYLIRRAEAAKKYKAKKQDQIMGGKNAPKSPSATDVQSGNVRGAVKLNKSKTTVKKTATTIKKVGKK